MGEDVVRWNEESPVSIVTLNRPDVHNVVDETVMTRLESVLGEVEANRKIRALILTGAGDRTFSAGGDLKYFATLKTRRDGLEMSRRMQAILARLNEGERLVIAAVNGQALGGGCEILTACHLRIAADTAKFSFRQAANGLITGWGGGTRLFALVGQSRALDLMLTSRDIDADEAMRMGFIDRVVPPSKLMVEANELADRICANSAQSVRAFLELARNVGGADPGAAVRRETELFGECWESETFQQVLKTFNKGRES